MSMTQEQTNIMMILLKANAPIKVRDIAGMAGIVEMDRSFPATRALILDLIERFDVCIGSTSKGYQMLQTGKDVQEYLNSLLARQLGISKRIQAVYNAAKKGGII